MLRYAVLIVVVILASISYIFFNQSEKEPSQVNPEQQTLKNLSPKNESNETVIKPITENNAVTIPQTEKVLVETIEDIPDKVEPSNNMKKIRTEDGHVMLYDTEGRLIKKEFPDGKIELYNYTRDGERILVKN